VSAVDVREAIIAAAVTVTRFVGETLLATSVHLDELLDTFSDSAAGAYLSAPPEPHGPYTLADIEAMRGGFGRMESEGPDASELHWGPVESGLDMGCRWAAETFPQHRK
jgi:hypothetical protein